MIGRGHYHWRHETCWYAVKKGAQAHWAGDRKASTLWDDVTAELEELWRETEMQRADLMALENAPGGSGVLEGAVAVREWPRAGWARLAIATMGRRCRIVAGSLPVRVPRSEPVSRYAAHASYAGSLSGVRPAPRSRGVGHSACSAARKPRPTDTFGRPRVRRSRRPSSAATMRAVFQLPGQHDFRGGRAARRQFGREPDPATVRRHARLDAGGAGGRGEAALNL